MAKYDQSPPASQTDADLTPQQTVFAKALGEAIVLALGDPAFRRTAAPNPLAMKAATEYAEIRRALRTYSEKLAEKPSNTK